MVEVHRLISNYDINMTTLESAVVPAEPRKLFSIEVPGPTKRQQIIVSAGTSIIFVGANGGGKTRLAVLIEDQLGPSAASDLGSSCTEPEPFGRKNQREQRIGGAPHWLRQ